MTSRSLRGASKGAKNKPIASTEKYQTKPNNGRHHWTYKIERAKSSAFALEIVDFRACAKAFTHRAHARRTAWRPARDDAQLFRVGIAADFGSNHGGEAEIPQRFRAGVDKLMRVVRADAKG